MVGTIAQGRLTEERSPFVRPLLSGTPVGSRATIYKMSPSCGQARP